MYDLKQLSLIVLLIISVIFISCDEDDPVSPEEDHFEAIGTVFYESGIEIARILRGVTEDTLKVSEGARSGHIEVKFIDEDENIVDPPSDEDQKLTWEFDDQTIAGVWQHEGEEGEFEFHLDGLEEGDTHVEFFITHGDHSDYRSGKIPVKVDHEDSHQHGEPVGFRLIDEHDGDTLVTVNDQTVIGTLTVSAGQISEHIEVEFFDANGTSFQPSVPEHSLSVESGDTNILNITGQEASEPWAFKVQGVTAGATTITVKILHDGHVEETFVPISVTVN